jgi:hypothetical protein
MIPEKIGTATAPGNREPGGSLLIDYSPVRSIITFVKELLNRFTVSTPWNQHSIAIAGSAPTRSLPVKKIDITDKKRMAIALPDPFGFI